MNPIYICRFSKKIDQFITLKLLRLNFLFFYHTKIIRTLNKKTINCFYRQHSVNFPSVIFSTTTMIFNH